MSGVPSETVPGGGGRPLGASVPGVRRSLPAAVRFPLLLLLPVLAGVVAFHRAVPPDRLEVPYLHPIAPPKGARRLASLPMDAASLAEGRATYQRNCRPCHGAAAQGDGPLAGALRRRPTSWAPRLLAPRGLPAAASELTLDAAMWRARTGWRGLPPAAVPWDSAMPSWGTELDEAEIAKALRAAMEAGEGWATATPPPRRRSAPERETGPASAAWLAAVVPPMSASSDLDRARIDYDSWCASCHGAQGRGDGPVAPALFPRPRDFTDASGGPHFKLRSTRGLPTDEDLFRTIGRGLPSTAMPGWETVLPAERLWGLVDLVKSFAPDRWATPPAEVPVPLSPEELAPSEGPKDPSRGAPLREEGKAVYALVSCWQCHGKAGRGNGPAIGTHRDAWGLPTIPTDLTKPGQFKAGRDAREVYRTLACGMGGTPMPVYLDSLDFGCEIPIASLTSAFSKREVEATSAWLSRQPSQQEVLALGDEGRVALRRRRAWALAAYVVSLADDRPAEGFLRALSADRLPDDPADPLWSEARPVRVPLLPQALESPRSEISSIDDVEVRALASGNEVAFRLAWDDRSADRGEPLPEPKARAGFPDVDPEQVWRPRGRDAVAIEVPIDAGPAWPHFLLGEPERPVRLWIWNAATGMEEMVASGPASFRAARAVPTSRLSGRGAWEDGRWTVTIRGRVDAALSKNEPLPFAILAWDGASGDAGLKMSLSAWQGLLAEDLLPLGALARGCAAALGVLLLEGALLGLRGRARC